ncbi:trehalose-phosphatase, partial [Mycobacterium sp. IS-1590]|uniref:trehalose-phosphatase n=1 Tax=Mycobacterium sp. IS-1590 TaxID=1772286 RepID=UPI0009EB8362
MGDVKTPVTIDPRLYDAALFGLDSLVSGAASTVTLAKKLNDAGIGTALYSTSRSRDHATPFGDLEDLFTVGVDGVVAEALGSPEQLHPAVLLEASAGLGVAPERSVVFEGSELGVRVARQGGFALVVGVAPAGSHEVLLSSGADVVVSDVDEVSVRSGDRRISDLPNALDTYGQLITAIDGRRPVVCLDFDGTLSEIVSDPDVAVPVEGAAEALAAMAQQCPVAILSGRDLADIRVRVGVPGVWYAGSHGFEMVGPDGTEYRNHDAAAAVPALQQAAEGLSDRLGSIPGVYVERKRYAIAVHYRNASEDCVAEIVATTHEYGTRLGLRVTTGRKVVELRPDIDWDKGSALKWIQDQLSSDSRLIPIYIGDDLTDEDAFDALRA